MQRFNGLLLRKTQHERIQYKIVCKRIVFFVIIDAFDNNIDVKSINSAVVVVVSFVVSIFRTKPAFLAKYFFCDH